MRKIITKIGFFLLGMFVILPSVASAAYDAVTFDADTTLNLSGIPLNLTVRSGSQVAGLAVYTTYITVDLEVGSNITIVSPDSKELTNSHAATSCGSSESSTTLVGTGTTTITVTPGDTCTQSVISSGGGGSSPLVTPAPSTSSGTVNADPAKGGSTSYINPDGGSAALSIPAAAISRDTTFSVEAVSASAVNSAPTGLFMVAGQTYQITAEDSNGSVTSFDSSITITFTYADDQLGDVDESSIQIYYYDTNLGTWVALDTTLNTTSNTASAGVIHFSDFALMGDELEDLDGDGVPDQPDDDDEDAATIEELEAQVAELLNLIAIAQAKLSALLGYPVVSGVPAGFKFTQRLDLGMSHSDVKNLQIVLNSDPDTKLASSGVGSSGRETMYFGPLTKAGVIKFQEKYTSEVLAPWNLTSGTGVVGTTTREKLNSLIGQ